MNFTNLLSKIDTQDDIRAIRKAYRIEKNKAVKVIELAKQYNVSQETIRRIAHYKSYAWVPDVE